MNPRTSSLRGNAAPARSSHSCRGGSQSRARRVMRDPSCWSNFPGGVSAAGAFQPLFGGVHGAGAKGATLGRQVLAGQRAHHPSAAGQGFVKARPYRGGIAHRPVRPAFDHTQQQQQKKGGLTMAPWGSGVLVGLASRASATGAGHPTASSLGHCRPAVDAAQEQCSDGRKVPTAAIREGVTNCPASNISTAARGDRLGMGPGRHVVSRLVPGRGNRGSTVSGDFSASNCTGATRPGLFPVSA